LLIWDRYHAYFTTSKLVLQRRSDRIHRRYHLLVFSGEALGPLNLVIGRVGLLAIGIAFYLEYSMRSLDEWGNLVSSPAFGCVGTGIFGLDRGRDSERHRNIPASQLAHTRWNVGPDSILAFFGFMIARYPCACLPPCNAVVYSGEGEATYLGDTCARYWSRRNGSK